MGKHQVQDTVPGTLGSEMNHLLPFRNKGKAGEEGLWGRPHRHILHGVRVGVAPYKEGPWQGRASWQAISLNLRSLTQSRIHPGTHNVSS